MILFLKIVSFFYNIPITYMTIVGIQSFKKYPKKKKKYFEVVFLCSGCI